MPRPEEKLISLLKRNRVDFTASLPCEKIGALLSLASRSFAHVPLTREEEGVGICAGAALAGRRPAMFVQSGGIGNMINALLSLTVFYQFPLAIFVSHRGVYREKIEAQVPMGARLTRILQGAGIPVSEIGAAKDLAKVEKKLPDVYRRDGVRAFLLSPAVWEGSECGMPDAGSAGEGPSGNARPGPGIMTPAVRPTLTRYDVIRTLSPFLEGRVVVSNLGWPSKELYAVKHQPSNFYMLGSMGMAIPIGLGIALNTDSEVVVIDGDGSLLMNPGTLAQVASLAPKNLRIVVIDNGTYGSTGDQPTLAGRCVDLEAVARGFGVRGTVKASRREEIVSAMDAPPGTAPFLHVLAVPGNADVPVIPLDRLEIRGSVSAFLAGKPKERRR